MNILYNGAIEKARASSSARPCLSKHILNRNDKSEHITHLNNVVRIIITWSAVHQSVWTSFLPNKRKIYGGNIHTMAALSHSFKPNWNAIWENTLAHSESALQSMANDVNILCVKDVNMPNTIFKATKAEEEKKISLRVIFRNKKNPPMQTTARKRPADMSIHRVLSDDMLPSGSVTSAHLPKKRISSWKHIQLATIQYKGTFHHDFFIWRASFV